MSFENVVLGQKEWSDRALRLPDYTPLLLFNDIMYIIIFKGEYQLALFWLGDKHHVYFFPLLLQMLLPTFLH